MTVDEINSELAAERQTVESLARRLDTIERRLPSTNLLSSSFLARAFAVLGHYIVAMLTILLPFYILSFLVMYLFKGG